MNFVEIEKIAKDLMNEHNLEDWSFGWDNAKRRFGCCNYVNKHISLSKVLTPLRTENAIRNTILHEIAHVLVFLKYKSRGHGLKWRMIFIGIGGSGERCSSDKVDVSKISKFIGHCPNGHIYYRHKKPTKKTSCGICSPRFNIDYLITYKLNDDYKK